MQSTVGPWNTWYLSDDIQIYIQSLIAFISSPSLCPSRQRLVHAEWNHTSSFFSRLFMSSLVPCFASFLPFPVRYAEPLSDAHTSTNVQNTHHFHILRRTPCLPSWWYSCHVTSPLPVCRKSTPKQKPLHWSESVPHNGSLTAVQTRKQ